MTRSGKIVRKSPVPPDIEIAQAATMRPIQAIAEKAGILDDELELYGRYKAKIDYMAVLERLKDRPDGKIIDVTAITPTPLGEGKTVTSIGLTESMNAVGIDTMLALREPSLGPVFGIKGGAAGGGYSQVVPMEDLNLHFTGDIHAVGAANNLLAAMVDSHLMHGNELRIDPLTISWRRCVDLNDRAMREIVNGLGGKLNGIPRQTGYDITVASEVMAILGLATSLKDLRERLGRITFGYSTTGEPLTAEDIGAAGAMAVLLKDALKPNLMQTLEGNPALVHAGPFANIAQGNNSIIADKVAMKLADYVVTESGFGADMGAEKFMDLICRYGGFAPSAVVITCTMRALKMHGGLPAEPELLKAENDEALAKGCENLAKQIENMKYFGVPVVVTINRFAFDRDTEVEIVRREARAAGAEDAVPIAVHALGGDGGHEAAEVVRAAADKGGEFRFLYPLEASIKEKIETIATKIYGADGVDYLPEAEAKIELFTKQGLDRLPICMAKTHLSLSHDPALKGRPRGFRVPIRDIRPATGAGYLYPLLGEMRTMPGLPKRPAAVDVDVDVETGRIIGLF
ncbi:MAG TPA: formate--tetrahydrofolate ligase [Thermoleophilia bacterium]|nr:formate--tetrahydrofolate ligase [Thermoleophilia bacterium]HQG03744.1 formate--tetrahydrofolate ligase [Thermoleophilia bacterium]HQJ98147.1 formate--tetrahydrofolate ligase [Thermoleophilia bacterium]